MIFKEDHNQSIIKGKTKNSINKKDDLITRGLKLALSIEDTSKEEFTREEKTELKAFIESQKDSLERIEFLHNGSIELMHNEEKKNNITTAESIKKLIYQAEELIVEKKTKFNELEQLVSGPYLNRGLINICLKKYVDIGEKLEEIFAELSKIYISPFIKNARCEINEIVAEWEDAKKGLYSLEIKKGNDVEGTIIRKMEDVAHKADDEIMEIIKEFDKFEKRIIELDILENAAEDIKQKIRKVILDTTNKIMVLYAIGKAKIEIVPILSGLDDAEQMNNSPLMIKKVGTILSDIIRKGKNEIKELNAELDKAEETIDKPDLAERFAEDIKNKAYDVVRKIQREINLTKDVLSIKHSVK